MGTLLDEGYYQTSNYSVKDPLTLKNSKVVNDFVDKINKLKVKYRMGSTNFTNPMGAADLSSFGTAEDMIKLSRAVLSNSIGKSIINTR